MPKLNYESLVNHLQKEASISTEKISVFIRNLETQKEEIIMNNTEKRYNWAFIMYNPNNKNSSLSVSPDERSFYYCQTLEDVENIVKFLLNNASYWMIQIDQDDVLEQQIYENI